MPILALLLLTPSRAEPAPAPAPASPVDVNGPPRPTALPVVDITATWSTEDEVWTAPLTVRVGTSGKRVVEFYDEIGGKRARVWTAEIEVPEGGQLTETLELEPLVGFNAGRTYWVVVRPAADQPPLGETRLTLVRAP